MANPRIDSNTVAATDPKANWVYVTVPATDMFDFVHPGVGINREHYGPGTHLVPPDVAKEIQERLAIFEAQNIRVLQPKRDMKALTDLARNKGNEYTGILVKV